MIAALWFITRTMQLYAGLFAIAEEVLTPDDDPFGPF